MPADVWRTLAVAALAAEGGSLAAWLRLSLVSRTWRDSLAGAYRLAACWSPRYAVHETVPTAEPQSRRRGLMPSVAEHAQRPSQFLCLEVRKRQACSTVQNTACPCSQGDTG